MDKQLPVANYSESNVVRLERQFFGDQDKKTEVMEFEKFFKFLNRFKYMLALFLVFGAIMGYFISVNKTPFYQTSVNIVVEPESSNRTEFLNDRLRYFVPKSFYQTQQVVMKSHVVLDKAARSLSPVIVQKLFAKPEQHWISNYLDELKSRLTGWLSLIGITQTKSDAKQTLGENADSNYSIKQIAKSIQENTSVSFGNTQQLIYLKMISSDPLVAAVVANAVGDAYISFLIENRVSQTEKAGQWLAERIAESRDKLTKSEDTLKEFQFQEQLPDLSTVKSIATNTLGQVNSALLNAQQNYSELSKRYGPKHPELIEAKKKLANAQSQFGRVSRTDLSANENRFELTKLERAVNSNRELYELFILRFNEVELGIDAVSSNTQILERASIPAIPFTPNVKKATSTGSIVGLLIGILFLISRELFDRTFKNQIEVEERLQLPVLGILPLLTAGKFRKKPDSLIPERHYYKNSKSNFAEVVNHIRTGIIYSNMDNPPKVILVTSALPKEGKTTCATNLSLAFSKLGKTLLIDADFRKPRIAKIVNVENINGLTGYVAGQNSLQECLSQDNDSENLFIMKSGEIPPNPLEMLSSNSFKNTLELMKKDFDYILIDSAPLIPVSDGVVLGKLADAILLVLKAGSTSHHVSETALKRFTAANLKPVGVILSQLDYRSSHYYYGKYDYYTKEYYG